MIVGVEFAVVRLIDSMWVHREAIRLVSFFYGFARSHPPEIDLSVWPEKIFGGILSEREGRRGKKGNTHFQKDKFAKYVWFKAVFGVAFWKNVPSWPPLVMLAIEKVQMERRKAIPNRLISVTEKSP